MKLTHTNGVVTLTVENPDERLKELFAQRFRETYEQHYAEFFQEVSLAVRKIARNGGTVTITSEPFEARIASPAPPVSESLLSDIPPVS